MYNVVICDDEPIIRESLSEYIESNFTELQVSGVFFDGAQVLEYLKSGGIDILITDIKMKDKTGIDVLNHIYEHSISTQVILITGYEEFEYAKEAIRCHACGMLTKPINLNELEKVLTDAKKNISMIKENVLHTSASFLNARNHFKTALKEFMLGGTSHSSLESLCPPEYKNNLSCKLAIINCSFNDNENINGTVSWEDIAEEKSEEIDAYIISSTPHSAVIAAFLPLGSDIPEVYTEHIEKSLRIFNNVCLKTEAVYYENILKFENTTSSLYEKYYSAVILHHTWENAEFFGATLPHATVKQLRELISDMCNFCDTKYATSLAEKYAENLSSSFEKEALLKLFNEVHSQIQSLTPSEFDMQILISYIESNYANSSITLDTISKQFGLSYATINRLFKKEAGLTFVSYLTNIRINKAKEIISQTSSIKNLAEQVGYTDRKYFSKIFKRHTLLTPSEYLAKTRLGKS